MLNSEAIQEIDNQIRSNRILLYIVTHEERRLEGILSDMCQRERGPHWNLVSWDMAVGFRKLVGDVPIPGTTYPDQVMALRWFMSLQSDERYTVLYLPDFHRVIGDDRREGQAENTVVRLLHHMSNSFLGKNKIIVIGAPVARVPTELSTCMHVVDLPLPDKGMLQTTVKEMLEEVFQRVTDPSKFRLDYNEEEMEGIVRAMGGLTDDQVRILTPYIMLTNKVLHPTEIGRQKREIVRQTGLLEWVEVENGEEAIGGMDALKKWLRLRKAAYTDAAREYGILTPPKGVLLMGVQGCGKSLVAKTIAGMMEMPLLRLDMGRVFSSAVGSSEQNIRHAIKIAEGVAPSVLHLDEIDKGLAGSGSSDRSDAGTAARVFGSILTWLQERNSPVFVVATGNNVGSLPPELLRKGRFDEVFFIDVPMEQERHEIFRIHMQKRGLDPERYNIAELVEASSGYTGAEIESIIVEGMINAFGDSGRPTTNADFASALEDSRPLSVMMAEEVNALRDWARSRARSASTGVPPRIVQPEVIQSSPVTVPNPGNREL